MTEYKIEPEFHMHAESLMSKWGFGDGDALDDWWWDSFDEGPPFNAHDVLFALVSEYLAPALQGAGHEVTLKRIHTIHNPVRAETFDGAEVDWYGEDGPSLKIAVSVTRAQILNVAERLEKVKS